MLAKFVKLSQILLLRTNFLVAKMHIARLKKIDQFLVESESQVDKTLQVSETQPGPTSQLPPELELHLSNSEPINQAIPASSTKAKQKVALRRKSKKKIFKRRLQSQTKTRKRKNTKIEKHRNYEKACVVNSVTGRRN